MDSKVAVISILVRKPEAVDALNALLHRYRDSIIGRMGIPYREKKLNLICIALDAPVDTIRLLAGELNAIDGLKTAVAEGCDE